MSSKMKAHRVTPSTNSFYSWQEWDKYVESCKFNNTCDPFTTDSVFFYPEAKANTETSIQIFDIGTYSGELTQFSKIIVEKDYANNQNISSIPEESTKAEEKSYRYELLSDLKISTESFGSEKGCPFLVDYFGECNNKIEFKDDINTPKNDAETILDLEHIKNFKLDIHHECDESNEATFEYPNHVEQQQVRWRKSDDQTLFTYLNEILSNLKMDINEFCLYSIRNYKPPVLMNLIEKTGWRGSETSFIQRIIKLYNSSRTLSIREMKKLRMTYYKQIKDNEVDWNKILYIFPGKNLEYLKETCNNFKRTKKLIKTAKSLVSRT